MIDEIWIDMRPAAMRSWMHTSYGTEEACRLSFMRGRTLQAGA